MREQFEKIDVDLERMRQRKHQIELEIARLVQAIADGQGSQSLMAAIGEREKELRDITDRLLEPQPESVRAKLDELRAFAIERMTRIRELLAHSENVAIIKASLDNGGERQLP